MIIDENYHHQNSNFRTFANCVISIGTKITFVYYCKIAKGICKQPVELVDSQQNIV